MDVRIISLQIGLDLNAISNLVSDEDYAKIKDRLDSIEQNVLKLVNALQEAEK